MAAGPALAGIGIGLTSAPIGTAGIHEITAWWAEECWGKLDRDSPQLVDQFDRFDGLKGRAARSMGATGSLG